MSGSFTNGMSLLPLSSLTGLEQAPFDTQRTAGVNPETGALNLNLISNFIAQQSQKGVAFKNLVDGGDFSVNPFQRGTTFTGLTNTVTYTADRFFVDGGASSSISVSRAANTTVAGFSQALLFGRGSTNTDLTAINLGQILDSPSSIRLQGTTMTLSFWAQAGANFSAALSAISVTVATGTGTNGSAANFLSGGWTGYAIPAITNNQSGVTGAAATAATQIITTTMTRYSFTFTVPAAALQVGFGLSYVPVGIAGSADNIILMGFQLEVGTVASAFEHLDPGIVLSRCQRYFFVLNEGASTVAPMLGQCLTTSTAHILVNFPVPMRVTPTTIVATIGTFAVTIAAGTTTALSTLAAVATSAWTGGVRVLATASGTTLVAGNATQLLGGGGSGLISASADL